MDGQTDGGAERKRIQQGGKGYYLAGKRVVPVGWFPEVPRESRWWWL